MIDLGQGRAVSSKHHSIAREGDSRPAEVELIEHEAGTQVVGGGIGSCRVEIKDISIQTRAVRTAGAGRPFGAVAPVTRDGAIPSEGQVSHRETHRRLRGVDGPIVGLEGKTVGAAVVIEWGIGHGGRGAAQGAIRGRGHHHIGQRATFHVGASQRDRPRKIDRHADTLCQCHRRVVHRGDGEIHGRGCRVEKSVVGFKCKTIRTVVVRGGSID